MRSWVRICHNSLEGINHDLYECYKKYPNREKYFKLKKIKVVLEEYFWRNQESSDNTIIDNLLLNFGIVEGTISYYKEKGHISKEQMIFLNNIYRKYKNENKKD